MMKAYDKVDRTFFVQVLKKFGFHNKIYKWITSWGFCIDFIVAFVVV